MSVITNISKQNDAPKLPRGLAGLLVKTERLNWLVGVAGGGRTVTSLWPHFSA